MLLSESIIQAFAPTGCLRAAINLGNPVLAKADTPTGAPYGVSVDIAHALGSFLGIPVEFAVFTSAAKSVEAVASGQADIGFFAVDPGRGEQISFTEAYLHIEGWYAVRQGSAIRHNSDVDGSGVRVAVSRGSAYDLFLSRELAQTEIVRAPNPQSVLPLFLESDLEVMAGVKQQLEADMRQQDDLRLLPERFMVIRQAMGMARRRGLAPYGVLVSFVEELKLSGFIVQALARHGIEGATVAPAAVD